MTVVQILAVLLTMFTGSQASKPQPYSVPEYLDAIVQTGHGSELWWYEPRVEYVPQRGDTAGRTSCWPPVYSGVAYITPGLDPRYEMSVVIHELLHLANNCSISETEIELATFDVLAYLGERDVLAYNLGASLWCTEYAKGKRWSVRDYCRIPVYSMLYDDISLSYPYLYRMLERIGVRERSFFVGRAVLEVR